MRKKGEVWKVDIPIAPGHGQVGERPAVVVQDDPFNLSLPTTLVIPLTGTRAAARFAGTLLVQPDAINGLSAPSVALVFQLRALDQRFFLYRLGTLDDQSLAQIYAVMDRLMGR